MDATELLNRIGFQCHVDCFVEISVDIVAKPDSEK